MSYTPPPPPPPYGSGEYGHGDHPAPRTNQKALWSMVLGILGIVLCGLFAGIPALILGSTAKREIASSQGAQTGEGMARAGVILGWVAVAISALGLLLVVTGSLGLNQYRTG